MKLPERYRDPVFQQREDAAMQELLSDPPSQHLKDVDPPSLGGLPPHDPNNWAINFTIGRECYIHRSLECMSTSLRKRHASHRNTAGSQMQAIMKEQFKVHSQVVKEYESGKARHNERVAASIDTMKKRQQEQMLEEHARRSRTQR